MKKLYTLAVAFLVAFSANSQSFSNVNNSLPGSYNSGGCVGVVDMNQDGLDDIVVLDGSTNLFVLYQVGDGTFVDEFYGEVSGSNQWGMCIADVDNNGHNDVFSGGAYDGVHYVRIYSQGDYEHVQLEDGSMFMQGCNIADINNDSWLDAFGCHDDAESRIWANNEEGNLDPANDWIDMATTPESDNSGNYGSVWTDFDRDGDIDLFIAKCRQGVQDPFDPRRINALFVNDGMGNYTEDAADRGLVIHEQSWTSDFADIDNDGDYDCLITNHSTTLTLLENDGNGYFTDITEGSGLEVSGFFLQAKMVDFDNDGWVDLLFSGGVDGCFRNNGDNTFTEETGMFPYGDTMHSFGIGDLNNDGWLDVYASYGNGYVNPDYSNDDVLWINDGGDNNWIGFNLLGIESNKNAVGATIEIMGDFGVQIREVRAGESYGITNTFKANFGLGEFDSVDLVTVYWPSGEITTTENPDINTYSTLIEAPCALEDVEVMADGETTVCEGETVTLSAPAGYVDYEWNTGSNGISIDVETSGTYSVIVYDDMGCAGVSNAVSVTVLQPALPTITVSGELEFCEGGSVTLISSDAVSYEWSNGEETQVITVEETGDYTVSVVDQCENPLESGMISVNVLETADTPVVNDVTIDDAGTATFDATGNDLQWYESEMATDPVGSGDNWTTPWIETTTSYWVEDRIVHGGAEATGGKEDISNGQYHDNSNYWLIFDAHEDVVIQSVKVFADGAGPRTIRVIDELNQTIDEVTVEVADGESVVEVNLEVPEGTNYGLRCTDDDPQLWRDSSPDENLDYPFAIGDVATITSSSVNGDGTDNYYYFFYEWTVKAAETFCPSDRIEVTAIVLGLEELDGISSFKAYPNPVQDQLMIDVTATQTKSLNVSVLDALGRTVTSTMIFNTVPGSNLFQLDLSNLSTGAYQLQVMSEGQRAVQQLIVE